VLRLLILKNGRDALIFSVEVSYRDNIKPVPSGLAAYLYLAFVLEEVRCILLLHNSALAVNLYPINYIGGY
jgi:hypothetical protein